jgi:hypothetical protein
MRRCGAASLINIKGKKMALILGSNDSKKIEVDAVEALENGKTKTHKFTVEYRVLPKAEWDATFNSKSDLLMIDVAMDAVKSIDGIVDEGGNPVAYDDDVKQAILNCRWLHEPIADGFMAVNNGKTLSAYRALKLKNS